MRSSRCRRGYANLLLLVKGLNGLLDEGNIIKIYTSLLTVDENGTVGGLVGLEAGGLGMAQQLMAGVNEVMMAFSGGVATLDWETNTLTVYSTNLDQSWTYPIPMGTNCSLQRDESLYLWNGEGIVTRLSLVDQSEQTFSFPAGILPQDVFLCQDNRALLRCSDETLGTPHFAWLNWNDETAESVELANPHFGLSSGWYHAAIPGHEATWITDFTQEQFCRLEGSSSRIIQLAQDRVLSQNDRGELTVHDLELGTSMSCTVSDISDAVLCGDLVYYLEQENPGKVFLWNPASSEVREDAVQVLTGKQLGEEIRARTDLTVYWGEAALNYSASCVSEPVNDSLLAYLSLEQLQLLVEEYPAGMFQEMCTEDYKPIEVYLTGAIHDPQADFDPIGFTAYTGSAQIVVLDIISSITLDTFRASIAHQFMRVMENRINQHSQDTGLDYLAYWMSFVPYPEFYADLYAEDPDSYDNPPPYTPYSDTPIEEMLFLDPISRTSPIHDRALILEYLYIGENSSYAEYLRTGMLRQKAQYLCAVIRECFPSCQIEGKLPWESLVDVVPFSEYEEAVRAY